MLLCTKRCLVVDSKLIKLCARSFSDLHGFEQRNKFLTSFKNNYKRHQSLS